jgi:hypothetical protein
MLIRLRAVLAVFASCVVLLYASIAASDFPVRERAKIGVQSDGVWTLVLCENKQHLETIMDAARLLGNTTILRRVDLLQVPTCERMGGYMNITLVHDTYQGRRLVKVLRKPSGQEDSYAFDGPYYSITRARPHRSLIPDRQAYVIGQQHEQPFYGTVCDSAQTVYRRLDQVYAAETSEVHETLYDLRNQSDCSAQIGDITIDRVFGRKYQYGPRVQIKVARIKLDVYHDHQDARTFFTWIVTDIRDR